MRARPRRSTSGSSARSRRASAVSLDRRNRRGRHAARDAMKSRGWAARIVSGAAFIDLIGGRESKAAKAVRVAFRGGGADEVRSLWRDDRQEAQAGCGAKAGGCPRGGRRVVRELGERTRLQPQQPGLSGRLPTHAPAPGDPSADRLLRVYCGITYGRHATLRRPCGQLRMPVWDHWRNCRPKPDHLSCQPRMRARDRWRDCCPRLAALLAISRCLSSSIEAKPRFKCLT